MSLSVRDGRLICCHGGPHIQHEQILKCWECGNFWHYSCIKKRGNCCKNFGMKTQFKNSTHFEFYNAAVSAASRGSHV